MLLKNFPAYLLLAIPVIEMKHEQKVFGNCETTKFPRSRSVLFIYALGQGGFKDADLKEF